MKVTAFLLILGMLAITGPASASSEREAFLELARKGWVYELRSASRRRTPDIPPIEINGRNMAGSALCIVGEQPHPRTLQVLQTFSVLMREVFGKPMPIRYAGPDIRYCGTGRSVHLRLYSGARPNQEYNDDIVALDQRYGLGFGRGRMHMVRSPAQAQTIFGARGQVTHLLVKQPGSAPLTPVQQRFFASILIEELYQSFTFGMDILHFDSSVGFVSKLEETPMNLRQLDWDSPGFMTAMLDMNPSGLCRFDVFMLHALAAAPVTETNSDAFLDYIDSEFDALLLRTDATLLRMKESGILDIGCHASRD